MFIECLLSPQLGDISRSKLTLHEKTETDTFVCKGAYLHNNGKQAPNNYFTFGAFTLMVILTFFLSLRCFVSLIQLGLDFK
jgi:hypothetical protein